MSVSDVGKMSAAEMDMWMIRAGTTPFLAKRIEVGLAQIAWILHGTNSKQKKELSDFMLFEKPAEQSLDEQILAAFSKIPKAK
jgi:hypothetical protein